MREIRFRIWDYHNKKFVEVREWKLFNNWDYYVVELTGHHIQQYTDLKDKNGQDIYEGDLIDYLNDDEFYEVIFYFGKFKLERIDGMGCGDFDEQNIQRNMEVIGNIFENPELLSEE